jgi:hypothetical protein
MAKLIAWNFGAPVIGSIIRDSYQEHQTTKTFVNDEHEISPVGNLLVQRQGSPRPLVESGVGVRLLEADLAAWMAGLTGGAGDTGRLVKTDDGPFQFFEFGTGMVRITGGRYASVTPAPAAPIPVLGATFTNITNFNIAAYDFQAYAYRLHANISIAYQALTPGAELGLRFHVVDSGATPYDYEYMFTTNANGYVHVSLSALHDHATLGGALLAGTVDLQVWSPLATNFITTAYTPGLTWTGAAYQYELTVMEV